MTATAADYAWFEDRPPGLSEAYCLTLARGLSPAELLARFRARPEQPRTGIAELFQPSLELWQEHPERGMLIAVTTVTGHGGPWALGVEVNGYLGVTEQLIVAVSRGTTAVSHFRNIEMVDRFYWIEDGDTRLSFEPIFASDRQGTTPDALADTMRQVGFDLRDDGENEQPTEAALALAERLTGVHVTPELLEESRYACGIAPVPLW